MGTMTLSLVVSSVIGLLLLTSSGLSEVEGYSITSSSRGSSISSRSRTSSTIVRRFSPATTFQPTISIRSSSSSSSAIYSPLFGSGSRLQNSRNKNNEHYDGNNSKAVRQKQQQLGRMLASVLVSSFPFLVFFNNIIGRISARIKQRSSKFASLRSKMKRSMMVVCASLFVWFSAGGFVGANSGNGNPFTPPAAHASTTMTTSFSKAATSFIEGPSLDEIVDDYVRDYMFDDDTYDPVESLYREAMDDNLSGTYPKALKEVSAEVLQGTDVMKQAAKAERESNMSIGSMLVRAGNFLQTRAGLTETQAVMVLAGVFAIGTPALLIFTATYVAMSNKRGMDRLMKKRYGQSYTTDATIKVEEDVELPDDDDDDDEDDDDDDDDEDNE